ncbi:MAG TPA: glycosyltransferase family 4 protein [Bacteroidota bacterium]
MKILIVNWQDIKNPLAGGAEVHLHEVFSRIAGKGHSVTLYCSRFEESLPEEHIDGMRVLREGGRYLFNFRFLFTYLKRLRKESFDIIIDDMNKIPFFTPWFSRFPICGVTHHLFGTSIFRETNFILAAYVFLMETLAVWTYKRHRIPFVVGSPSTYRELLQKGFAKESVHLVPYGVDHQSHKRTGVGKSNTPLIGYFGRLKKYKSVDHLLHAIPVVLCSVPKVRVVIAGEGDDRERLEELSRRLGLRDSVEFTGFISEERKLELLQQLWCKVTTSSKEGWGLTVIEANACGTPVIASNVEGLRDAVKDGETGLLYSYGDVNGLASNIIHVLTDDVLRHRLEENALRWSQEFDWDRAAEETEKLLTARLKEAG